MSRIAYWSKIPGKFVQYNTGEVLSLPPGHKWKCYEPPAGTYIWYESLVEIIIKCCENLDEKKIIISSEVANILAMTYSFRPAIEESKLLWSPVISKLEHPILIGTIRDIEIFVDPYMIRDWIHLESDLNLEESKGIRVLDLN